MSFAVNIERAQQPPDSFVISLTEDKSVFLRLDGQPLELDQPDFSVGTGGLLGICGAEIEARQWSLSNKGTEETARLQPEQLAIICLTAAGLSDLQINGLLGAPSYNHANRRKLAACKALSIDLIAHYKVGRLPQNRMDKELIRSMYEREMFIPRWLPDMSEEDYQFLMESGPHILGEDRPRDINYAITEGRQAQDVDTTPTKVEKELSGLRKRLGVGTLGLVTVYLAHKTWESKEKASLRTWFGLHRKAEHREND